MDGKGLCGILRKLPLPDAGGRTSSVKTWLLLYTDAKLDIYIFFFYDPYGTTTCTCVRFLLLHLAELLHDCCSQSLCTRNYVLDQVCDN
jgi:hypothetical protein